VDELTLVPTDVASSEAADASTPVKMVRRPASGPCACSRSTCWHARGCRGNGSVRIIRTPDPTKTFRPSVVLCRECAAPTQRNRVA
jgi:hypothetical protein